MPTPADLFLAYANASHADLAGIVSLFDEDGILEAPYFAALGFPWVYRGHEALRATYGHLLHNYPDLHFTNPRIIAATNAVAVGEYEFIATSQRTGRRVHQLAVAMVAAEQGRIRVLREFQNLVEVGLAIFPGGLADLKAPSDRDMVAGTFDGALL